MRSESIHQELFNRRNYKRLIDDLRSIQNKSSQEVHNLVISEYLYEGKSPLTELENLIKQIKPESNDSWQQVLSYPLVLYHYALYLFKVLRYEDCKIQLDILWENKDNLDNLLLLCISFLSIEYALITDDNDYLQSTRKFLTERFENFDLDALFKERNVSDATQVKLRNCLEYYELKIDICSMVKKKDCDCSKYLAESKLTDLSVPEILLYSYLAYYKNNKVAYKLILNDIKFNNSDSFEIINNRGIFEFFQHKYSSALLLFSRAVNSRHNHEMIYPFHKIIYNTAVSHLLNQYSPKPKDAFKLFYSILPLMSKSPFIWLRLAECIIAYYKHKIDKVRRKTQLSSILHDAFRTETQSYYILPASDIVLCFHGKNSVKEMTLQFAGYCASQCVDLCGNNKEHAAVRCKAELISAYIAMNMNCMNKAEHHIKTIDNYKGRLESSNGSTFTLASLYSSQIITSFLQNIITAKLKNSPQAKLYFALIAFNLDCFSHAEELLPQNETDSKEFHLLKIALELHKNNKAEAVNIIKSHDDYLKK